MDMFLFVCDQPDSGLVTLDEEQAQMMREAREQMDSARLQLWGRTTTEPWCI